MSQPIRPRQLAPTDEALATVRERLASLRFGSIAVTVHDGRIVQLDIVEKRRLAR